MRYLIGATNFKQSTVQLVGQAESVLNERHGRCHCRGLFCPTYRCENLAM
jgi:hypothetical protein